MAAMSLLRWQLARLLRRFGWPFFAGAVLVLAAAGIEVQALRWQARASASAIRAAELQTRPAVAPVEDPYVVTQARLKAFVESLPESKESAATVKRLFKIAERSGVSLAQGDYRATSDSAARLVRYQISLPVRGDSKRVHAFLVEALNEIRPLTLEGMSFRREKVASRELDAHIQFALVTRP